MEIIHDFPPNFDEIEKVFGSIPITVVFTYGSKIYAPGHGDISENLMVHEQIHEAQQAEAGGPESWWKRYLEDPIFRLEEISESDFSLKFPSIYLVQSMVELLGIDKQCK
jgi:hypothetical protein